MLRHRFALSLIAIAAVAFASHAAAFIVYKVGGDAACPYTSIQDAVDAAAANPGTDDIWIAMNANYSGQQINIVDQDVVIEGGFTDCDDIDIDTAETTVSGAGNAGGAVFTIRGTSNVYFSNFFITGASRDGDASGGGIDFDGVGSVELHESTIGLNSAGYGGGINVHGDGGHADLVIDNDMVILNNTAYTSGGGIRIEGDTRLYALQPNTLIDGNHALGGYGGGLEVLGPARADIGSPGYGDLGVIFFNDAQYGGGIAALAISDQADATVRLFSTDSANPVQVANNAAALKGGGIYLKSYSQFIPFETATASACAWNYRMNDNIAADGAALYADRDQDISGEYIGSSVSLNQSDSCGPEPPAVLGAVDCAPGIPCNEMVRNVAADSNATPTTGATILVDNTGTLYAEKLVLRNNTGGRAVRLIGETDPDSFSQAGGSISNCLFVDNQLSEELIRDEALHYNALAIDGCTFANNGIGAGVVIHSEDALSVTNTLIDQPDAFALEYSGQPALLFVRYLLSSDLSTLPSDPTVQLLGDPHFVDSANGNYHLQPTSQAADYAGGVGGLDLEGHPRDVNLPGVPDVFGPRDVGAYEIQLACSRADTIFCDGFDG